MIYTLIESENYIREHDFTPTCSLNLYCCQINLFQNARSCFYQFICYYYKRHSYT